MRAMPSIGQLRVRMTLWDRATKRLRIMKRYLPHSVAAGFALGFVSWLWIGYLETFKIETLFLTWFGWFLSMLFVVPAVSCDEFSSD